MRLFSAASLLLALTPAVLGQDATFLTGFIDALNSAGLTRLANVTAQLNSTAAGPSVLAQLASGRPYVVFAPTNNAFNAVPSNVTSDGDVLTDVVAYHIVSGNFSGVSTTYPNVTIGRSLLSDPKVVNLEGDPHQVVAWATRSDGKVHVLNQRNDATVQNTTTFRNVTINVIDQVLGYPVSLAETVPFDSFALSGVRGALAQVSVPFVNQSTGAAANATLFDVLNSGLRGFTLFAPNLTAIQAATASLAGLASNQSALVALFQNHLINGSTVYSPSLANGDITSAAGEPLSFTINATGQYVTSGNVTALITQPDVLLPNGVVHVIDRVLINTQSDAAAASSAASSASSTAAVERTASATGPVGFSATATLVSATGSASQSASGAQRRFSPLLAVPALQAVVPIAAMLIGMLIVA